MPRLIRPATLVVLAVTLTGSIAGAQTPRRTRADSLQRAVITLTARLDSLETGQCPGEAAAAIPAPTGRDPHTDSLATALARLGMRVERFRAERCLVGAAQPPAVRDSAAPADTSGGDLAALRAAANAAASTDQAGVAQAGARDTAPAGKTEFISRQRNGSLLNPEISATGDIRLNLRDASPQVDNGELREVEVGIQSALDPYSNTKIFLTFENGNVGVEEAYIYWTGLPGRLRADVGKFRQQLGDLNRWHLHALPETEYPLVYQRFLGDEGLSGIGISLYTPLPVSLFGGTHEIWLQGTTSESEPLYAGGRQPTVLGRLQNFWQLSPSTYAQLGATATGGNNADNGGVPLRTRLLGLDFRFTYRPSNAGTRRDITFRAEGYKLHADDGGTITNRYGTFLDLSAKLSQRWILSTRYDWVEAPRGPADTEWRITPAITWVESEFVFLRLQGEHRDSGLTGKTNLLTAQVVWAMGPHKHETY